MDAEVKEFKPEWRKDAYFDKETGMYTVPDPVVNDKEFNEFKLGDKSVFLPQPSHKSVRKLQFATPHAYISVNESLDACRTMIDLAKTDDSPLWFRFTDFVYGNTIAVHRDQLRQCAWVLDGFEDLDAIRMQAQMAEHAKNMQRMQMIQTQKGKN